jgi:hypothetical protein
LRPCRARRARGWRPALIDVNINVDVFVDDGPAAVGGKRLVGNFGWSGLVEQLGGGAALGAGETLIFVKAFSFHDSRASACAVFMEVNIAMASRKAVMLLKAVMVVLIATTTATTASDTSTAAAAASSTSSHALKLFAIPSLTTATRWLFEAVQVAR